ncbi:MAG: hypothetical protein KA160_00220, partial [Lacibacter sp.]|nr:hypothetical protein [Lacibacter sp.]
MGINSEIAHYFANERKVPADNAYWKNKRIYISMGFGFQAIPFMFDLLHKCGISTDVLLLDDHVTLMEKGFDKVGRYESNEITFSEFLMECKLLLQGKVKQPHLAADLFALFSGRETTYFEFETTHKALARSDSFLFTLVDLDVTDKWVSTFLPVWYSLARPILLLDDFKDLEEDRNNANENMIIELGDNKQAVEKAYEFGLQDLVKLSKVNP